MKNLGRSAVIVFASVLILLISAIGPISQAAAASPVSYVLTVESSNPASGVTIAVNPKDQSGKAKGTTKFTLAYLAGTSVTLTAPAKSGASSFVSWTGCTTKNGPICKVSMTANKTVTAKYSPATYVLTVSSFDPASGVSIKATSSNKQCSGSNATPFHCTLKAGTAVTLTAPQKAGGHSFGSWLGCSESSSLTCNVKLKANTTVTAHYNAPGAVAPTVKVTLSAMRVTTAQSLTVKISVTGVSGKPVPQGWVALESGSYASAATALSKGSASITIPAGTLAVGSGDKLIATYTPNKASASTYKSASGSALVSVTVPTYTLTVDSAYPDSGVYITANPADIHNKGYAATPFTLIYDARTPVQLTPSPSADGYSFLSWTGCVSTTKAGICNVTVNSNMTVTANYSRPNVTGVKIAPNPAVAIIGTPLQLTATVLGTGSISNSVNWSLTGPSGSSAGTLNPTSVTTATYITPYPPPASVQITAASTETPSISTKVTVVLKAPAAAAGPALTVNVGNQTHAISPLIYGMNAYALDTSVAQAANITVARWGGDNTSRYNYQTNTSNSASDWYFENGTGSGGIWPDGNFADFVSSASSDGIKALGTVPVLGWVTNDNPSACGFPATTYPNQYSFDPYNANCGDGEYTNGSDITGNDPTTTSISTPPPAPPSAADATQKWAESTWPGGWVESFVGKGQTGSSGGVAIWDLDNEPAWWDAVHRDVHPSPSTYDEVTNGGIGTALAIKLTDPTAQVSGPVIDNWWNYFYSKKDMENGWDSGPCYQPWDNPTDREAHGGVPMIEYYLQQFATAETTYGMRLLDYLDLHTYFTPQYPLNSNNSVGLSTAGDTSEQEERLDSTRVFWDPTYTDPDKANQPFPQPNYKTDPNYYTANCNIPAQAPQLIPMMKTWVANDYPGTKTAITEYNWGGQESINGAVAQADILGIFGSYGLDVGTLWGPPDPSSQIPGLMAFEIYRNYDGNKSTFGDMALASTSGNQGQLSVYGASRTSDNAITVMVINKTYGPLTSTLSFENFSATSGTMAQVYQYSNGNLNEIVSEPAAAVTPPANGGTTSTLSATFPGQSITLLVIPNP
jgi:hypothetical protein